MIRVCDSLMGSGKTLAAITFMNEHPDEKFIYITPFLDEAERIKKGCPELKFVEPRSDLEQYHYTKTEHAAALIDEGRNITTTHQAFRRYTSETLGVIREKGYILMIDENVDILESYDIHPDDLRIMVDTGLVDQDGNSYTLSNKEYGGRLFKETLKFFSQGELIGVKGDDNVGDLFFWILSAEFLTAFKDIYIMTYLFESQSLHHLLKMNNVPYEYIGTKQDDDGVYRFTEETWHLPEYTHSLADKVHIWDNPKMNEIGDGKYDLSMSWFGRDEDDVEQLKRNMHNFYVQASRNGGDGRQLLWGSFLDAKQKLKTKGCMNAFIPFNAKATNKYRDREALMYLANIFLNVSVKNFYIGYGIDVKEDEYALSVLTQWIWRSAIRDGKDVELYIPSSRMRQMLIEWMDTFNKGGRTV